MFNSAKNAAEYADKIDGVIVVDFAVCTRRKGKIIYNTRARNYFVGKCKLDIDAFLNLMYKRNIEC